MRLDQFLQNLGRAFGEAMAQNGKFDFDHDSQPGVTLDELELEGAAPNALKVALHRADVVRVVTGEKLAVTAEGEGADTLRFRLDEDMLRIHHAGNSAGPVRLTVTMPPPRLLAVSRAGTIEAETLADRAKVAIGGSGTIRVAKVAGEEFSARIGGSGTIEAAGRVSNLSLSIGGSGALKAKALEVDRAEIRIGGSGKVVFSSDGEVDARIGGAGDILVYGSPRCSLRAGGAGKLRCVPRESEAPAAGIDG